MNSKKTLLLAVLGLVAVAFAAPATASALTLKDAGQEVKDKDFWQKGTFKFLSAGGTMSCPMRFPFTIDGQTVTIPSFQLTIAGCSGTNNFANCTITKYSVEEVPWKITVDAKELTIKDVTVKTFFGGKNCPLNGKKMKISYEPWIATPNDPKAITSFTYKAKGTGTIESEEGETLEEIEIESGAESEIEEENATYEIA